MIAYMAIGELFKALFSVMAWEHLRRYPLDLRAVRLIR